MDISPVIESTPPGMRVLIVDDHPIMRKGVRHALARQPDFQVVGEVGSLSEALRQLAQFRPDIVVLDLVLGGRDGMEAIVELRRESPQIRILVFSMNPEEIFAPLALEARANGYLMKAHDFSELLRAMAVVCKGGTYLSPAMEHIKASGRTPSSEFAAFSEREMQVFLRLGEGRTTSEIAHELHLSVKTVFAHRDSLKAKLGVTSGAELMRRAIVYQLRQGTFPPPS